MSLNFRQVGSASQDLDFESRRFAAPSYAQEETVFFRFDPGKYMDEFHILAFQHHPRAILALIRSTGFLSFRCETGSK
jgi:hypothetical protein